MYANGFGTKEDMQEAKKWFKKAAKNGSQKGKAALEVLKKQGK